MAKAAYPNIRKTLFTQLPQISDQWFKRHFDKTRLTRWNIYGTEGSDLTWLNDKYIKPLLRLLGEYIGTGNESYLALYLDERLRYAPHRLKKDARVEFFKELVEADEQDLLAVMEDGSTDKAILKQLLKDIHAPLLSVSEKEPLEILALGDCLMNEVRVFLAQKCRTLGFEADMRSLYFSASENEELSADDALEYIKNNRTDALLISFFTFEGMRSFNTLMQGYEKMHEQDVNASIEQIMGSVKNFLLSLREQTQVPFFINTAGGLPLSRIRKYCPWLSPVPKGKQQIIGRLNAALAEVAAIVPNCIRIHEQSILRMYGMRAMAANVAPRWLRKDAFFHTSAFGEKLAEEYAEHLEVLTRLGKTKVLLVDFDNTLWHGVMADGPVVHYVDKQSLLRELKEAGILLVAVSKNSPENIRWEEMLLKPEDFALLKINWNMKAQSIEEAAAELNLGMDSFVLVDDNPAERELVKNALPKVAVLDALENKTWDDLRLMLKFPNTQQTEEAKKRTQMYQAQIQRQAALNKNMDYPKMMESLGLKMLFRKAVSSDLSRLYELINRTNQFNTTTFRYSKAEIKAYLEHPMKTIWVTELEDKFGKLGIIGVLMTAVTGAKQCVIESFVMSCRAMGYKVEQQMLSELSAAQDAQVKCLIGIYKETAKNGPCRSLYKNCGFTQTSETHWELSFDKVAAQDDGSVLHEQPASVGRVVGDTLLYFTSAWAGEFVASPDKVLGYKGEALKSIGLQEGAKVTLLLSEEASGGFKVKEVVFPARRAVSAVPWISVSGKA